MAVVGSGLSRGFHVYTVAPPRGVCVLKGSALGRSSTGLCFVTRSRPHARLSVCVRVAIMHLSS